MKRKRPKIPKPRNPFVAAAKFRVAGVHDKPYKSKRRNEKIKLKNGPVAELV
jgi:hypothetical protein